MFHRSCLNAGSSHNFRRVARFDAVRNYVAGRRSGNDVRRRLDVETFDCRHVPGERARECARFHVPQLDRRVAMPGRDATRRADERHAFGVARLKYARPKSSKGFRDYRELRLLLCAWRNSMFGRVLLLRRRR